MKRIKINSVFFDKLNEKLYLRINFGWDRHLYNPPDTQSYYRIHWQLYLQLYWQLNGLLYW